MPKKDSKKVVVFKTKARYKCEPCDVYTDDYWAWDEHSCDKS